jgi:hypothetical protein
MSSRAWRSLAACLLVLGTGCADSIVRILSPDNDPQTVNTPEKFQFTATDLRNVNDRFSVVWPNSAPKAKLIHDSFLHHGYGVLVVTDAAGVTVDSTLLELHLEAETLPGVPGNWTLTLIFAGARGRVNFTLTPEP